MDVLDFHSAVLHDPPTQPSLDQLFIPLELPPMRSPPPTFDWSITEEGEGSETRNEHTNTTASSGLGSPENPILIDIDCEEGDIRILAREWSTEGRKSWRVGIRSEGLHVPSRHGTAEKSVSYEGIQGKVRSLDGCSESHL
jgi:hypothetical protein